MKSTNNRFWFTNAADQLSDDQVFVKLLQMPDVAFVHAVYRKLLGRNPDSDGLEYYMALQERYGKLLVLAEIRVSYEGQQKRYMFTSVELDKLVRFYRVIRFLPFGGIRWKMLNLVVNHSSCFFAGSTGTSGGASSINKHDKLSQVFTSDFAANWRDVYWIQKISGNYMEHSFKDSVDEFGNCDLLMFIDRIYCSEKLVV